MLGLAPASPTLTSVVVGAADLSGTDDTRVVVVAGSIYTTAAFIDFSILGAIGPAEALPGCSKPRAKDFLNTTRKRSDFLSTTNLQNTTREYSGTYNEDFFTLNFFTLSALGAGAAPEVLISIGLLAEGEVCPDVVPDAAADH